MPSRHKKNREALSEDPIEELTLTVAKLTEQVRMLRQAVDEIGDELGWAIRNRVIAQVHPPPFHLTSFPLDPLMENFGKQVNAVSRQDVLAETGILTGGNSATNAKQIELW